MIDINAGNELPFLIWTSFSSTATDRIVTNGVDPIRHRWIALLLSQYRLAMKSKEALLGSRDDVFRSEDFVGSAMNYKQEFVCLQS